MELTLLVLSVVVAWGFVKIFIFMKDYIWKWKLFSKLPIAPDIKSYPLIGHALELRGNPDEMYEFIMSMIEKRPDASFDVGAAWLGMIPIVIVIGPNGAETLLHSSQHMEKAYFYTFLHSWLGTGLLTAAGEKWKIRRRLLTPTFHFSILKDFLVVMNEQAGIFAKKLEKYGENGEKFDICPYITLCTLDIICETAMGESVKAQDNEDSEYVRALYRTSFVLQERQKSPWLWPDFIFYLTKHGKEYSRCLKILHGFTRSVIEEKRRNFDTASKSTKSKRLAFLDLLFSVSDDGKVLSVNDIQEEVDTFMFEGHDTTAAALAWSIHLIGTHSDVQQKIHEEIDAVFGRSESFNITQDDLKKLEYLEKVVKESLRVFPSVPIIGRVTSEDCELNGHFIPKGTNCILFTQAVNTHPDHWDEPKKFDPDRFSTERSAGRHPYAYLPFSAGPRNCIGQKFALMEEKVILTHLLRKFRIEACDKTEDLRLTADIILRSRDGVNIKLHKRVP